MSDYKLQIVHIGRGTVVEWAPGLLVEQEFVDDLVKRVLAKGVGFGRTEAHVAVDVRAAIEEQLLDLKRMV